MDAALSPPAEPRQVPTSDLLEDLVHTFPDERVSVGELVDRLESRAIGVFLLILALPMLIPNIPGISTIFGVLMIAPALQLTFGHGKMWLPQKVRAWTFPGAGLRKALRAAIPALRRVEVLIKPRLTFLTRWPLTIGVGVQTLIMAIILILPIWGANLSPGVTVTLTALALLQRDGLLMLLSIPCAIGSMLWVYFGTKYGIMLATWLYDVAHNWIVGF